MPFGRPFARDHQLLLSIRIGVNVSGSAIAETHQETEVLL